MIYLLLGFYAIVALIVSFLAYCTIDPYGHIYPSRPFYFWFQVIGFGVLWPILLLYFTYLVIKFNTWGKLK